ncbi:MAG: gephyrin-like molybdotransferase Glp [Pseudomonadota bacterium]
MAQLSDDCFATGRPLMKTADALTLLAQRIVPVVETETLALDRAISRILAEDIVAPVSVPQHDNSAVDGYAVFFDDLNPDKEITLPVTGRAAAGHPLMRPARRGEAIRIFTGAPMPEGPDTVMMQEDCSEEGGKVTISPGIKKGSNRRLAGEDIVAGNTILRSGIRLRPQEVGLAASVGRTDVTVYRRLRAAVFSTGDEVCEPGGLLPKGMIYDSNRYTIRAALQQLGCDVTDLGILPDAAADITGALSKATAEHDVLVTSGGMSVGEEDHVRSAIEALGSLHFWMLAIKPGRPVALGQIEAGGRTLPIIGLPGNPVAVMVTFLVVARPLLLRLAGATDIAPTHYRVRAGFDYRKKKDRREFVRARLETGDDGILRAEKHGGSGAGVLSSLVGAHGLVELPEDVTHLEKGSMVDFLPFSEVSL